MKRFFLFLSAAALSMCMYADGFTALGYGDYTVAQYEGKSGDLHLWYINCWAKAPASPNASIREEGVDFYVYSTSDKGIACTYEQTEYTGASIHWPYAYENGVATEDSSHTIQTGTFKIEYKGKGEGGRNIYHLDCHFFTYNCEYFLRRDVEVIGKSSSTEIELTDDRPQAASEETTKAVDVTPAANSVEIVWAKVDAAAKYDLKIYKDGELVFEIIFDANGIAELIDHQNAPGRVRSSVQSAGFKYTIEGLEEGVAYTYSIDAKNSADEVIDHHDGGFTTGGGINTDAGLVKSSAMNNGQKLLRNGQLLILRDGKTYTVQGQEVK